MLNLTDTSPHCLPFMSFRSPFLFSIYIFPFFQTRIPISLSFFLPIYRGYKNLWFLFFLFFFFFFFFVCFLGEKASVVVYLSIQHNSKQPWLWFGVFKALLFKKVTLDSYGKSSWRAGPFGVVAGTDTYINMLMLSC